MDMERRGKLRWKRILTLAGIGALVPLLMLGSNLERDACEKHQRVRLEAKYRDGLWLCGSLDEMFDEYRRMAGAPPDLLVLVIPPPPRRWEFVAVSGNAVHVLELGRTSRQLFVSSPASDPGEEDSLASHQAARSAEEFPRTATLAPDLLADTVREITEDIHNARARPARETDGAGFLFFTASGQCGETSTPKDNSQAMKLVEAALALRQIAHSSQDDTRAQAIARLRIALESLQD